MVRNLGISLPEDTVDEVDARRPSTKSRSQWIDEAINARFAAEDAGEWETPTDESDNATNSATATN